MKLPVYLCAGLLVLVGACATSYDPMGWSGGFKESEVRSGVWTVAFGANAYTTRESAQTYWLYRCAQLTLEKGYDGFRVLTPMQLVRNDLGPTGGAAQARLLPVQYNLPPDNTKPWIQGSIQLLKKPFVAAPPASFDAAALKAALEPYVTGKKCDGNVCAHQHDYLFGTKAAGAAT